MINRERMLKSLYVIALAPVLFTGMALAQDVTIFGLLHDPLGQAYLGIEGDELVISNVNADGLDGVSVETVENAGYLETRLHIDEFLVGTTCTGTKFGSVNGVPGREVCTVTAEVVPGEGQRNAVLIGLGYRPGWPQTYSACVYNSGQHVLTVPGLSGASILIVPLDGPGKPHKQDGETADARCGEESENGEKGFPNPVCSSLKFPEPVGIKLGDHDQVEGDVVAAWPENPMETVDYVSNIDIVLAIPEIHAGLLSRFSILNQGIGVFKKLPYYALTQATTLTPLADGLIVVNPIGVGPGGVKADLQDHVDGRGAKFASFGWDPLTPATGAAFLEVTALGTVMGAPGLEIGTLRVAGMGSELEVTADYLPLGLDTVTVQIYDHGFPVVAIPAPVAGPIAHVPSWPRGCVNEKVGLDGTSFRLTWPATILIDIEGGPPAVPGDELAVLAQIPFTSMGSISSISIQVEDIPELKITQESSAPEDEGPLYPCVYGGLFNDPAVGEGPLLAAGISYLDEDVASHLAASDMADWFAWDIEYLDEVIGGTLPLPGDGLLDSYQMALVEYVLCHPEFWANQSVEADFLANKALFEADVAWLAANVDPSFARLEGVANVMAAMLGTSEDMQTTWNALFLIFSGDLVGLPSLNNYVVFGTGGEPFSAEGDLDGDGLSNAEELAQVLAAGGDMDLFVIATTDPGNFWPGNPDLPVATAVGLGLLAGAVALAGAFMARKKR